MPNNNAKIKPLGYVLIGLIVLILGYFIAHLFFNFNSDKKDSIKKIDKITTVEEIKKCIKEHNYYPYSIYQALEEKDKATSDDISAIAKVYFLKPVTKDSNYMIYHTLVESLFNTNLDSLADELFYYATTEDVTNKVIINTTDEDKQRVLRDIYKVEEKGNNLYIYEKGAYELDVTPAEPFNHMYFPIIMKRTASGAPEQYSAYITNTTKKEKFKLDDYADNIDDIKWSFKKEDGAYKFVSIEVIKRGTLVDRVTIKPLDSDDNSSN